MLPLSSGLKIVDRGRWFLWNICIHASHLRSLSTWNYAVVLFYSYGVMSLGYLLEMYTFVFVIYLALNDWLIVKNQLWWSWKELVMCLLQVLPSICLVGLRKMSSQSSWCLGWDSNRLPLWLKVKSTTTWANMLCQKHKSLLQKC